VLGNEVPASGEPSTRLAARHDCAFALYRAHSVRFIMASGGQGKSGFDEARVMKKYLVARGVLEEKIFEDSLGKNTMATAINASALQHARHFSGIIIVAQYYHVPRCLLAFSRAGVSGVSADYPRYVEAYDLFAVMREAVALPVYFAKMPDKN
jgi:vancomycin permeability regulator SanA